MEGDSEEVLASPNADGTMPRSHAPTLDTNLCECILIIRSLMEKGSNPFCGNFLDLVYT